MLIKRSIPLVALLWILAHGSHSPTNHDNAPISVQQQIRGIEIYGSTITRPEVLKYFFTFDTGSVLDTSQLRITRTNLLRTQLFSKVDIFPHHRDDGVHVFVIVKETVRLSLNYGGEYFAYKYGQEQLWWSLRFDASLGNFRGRMEELTTTVSFWDSRSFGLAWYKPLLPGPYFLSTGAYVAGFPDDALPMDYFDLSYRITLGRRLGKHSRIALSTIPTYRKRVTNPSHLPADSSLPGVPDTSRFYEAYNVLGLVNDFRSARFDPEKGWYLYSELRTNYLYSGLNKSFVQFSSDFRYYLPGFFDDKVVLRLASTFRNTDVGYNYRLLYGGEGQIRGYPRKALGWRFIANSGLLLSAKYHKPLWQSTPLPIPLLNLIYNGVNEITYRIDGTLIADYARLHQGPYDILRLSEPVQSGIGLGAGMRIVVPVIRQSGCIDLVYGRRSVPGSPEERTWKPMLHVYLDLFY